MNALSLVKALGPEVIENFNEALAILWPVILFTGFFLGTVLIVWGTYSLASNEKKSGGIVMIISGGILLNSPAMMDMLAQTFLSVPAPIDLYYKAPEGAHKLYVTMGVRLVKFFGLIAFIRSWLVFVEYNDTRDKRTLNEGFTYLFGSVLCLNIENTIIFIGNTLGGTVQDVIGKMF